MRHTVLPLIIALASFGSGAQEVSEVAVGAEMVVDASVRQLALGSGLQEKEIVRYQEIMDGPMGSYYRRGDANVFYVLGAESATDEEALRYARLWVAAEEKYHNKVGKMLRMYKLAALERFGEKPRMFDIAGAGSSKQPISLFKDEVFQHSPVPAPSFSLDIPPVEQRRLKLYINLNNCQECDAEVLKHVLRIKKGELGGLDIFVEDAGGNDMAIMSWAGKIGLSRDDVAARLITLNHTDGKRGGHAVPHTVK